MKGFLLYEDPPTSEENEFQLLIVFAESYEEAAKICGGMYEKSPHTGWDELHFPAEIFGPLDECEKQTYLEQYDRWFSAMLSLVVGNKEEWAAKLEAVRVYKKGPLNLVLEEHQREVVLYLRELPVLQK